MAAIYPSIRSSIDQIAKNYPSGLKEAFGVQAMNTVEGYIHAEMFSLIVPLAMGYFAIRAVTGANRRSRGARLPRHDPRPSRIPDRPDRRKLPSSLRWLARRSWR